MQMAEENGHPVWQLTFLMDKGNQEVHVRVLRPIAEGRQGKVKVMEWMSFDSMLELPNPFALKTTIGSGSLVN